MILSTLAELDAVTKKEDALKPPKLEETKEPTFEMVEEEMICVQTQTFELAEEEVVSDTQKQFYINLRERILVLFEGFQSPNNKNIEAKIDLTLNFLEYLLATIDEQLEKLDKPTK